MAGLYWSQTVLRSDGVSCKNFQAGQFFKKSADDKKSKKSFFSRQRVNRLFFSERDMTEGRFLT